LIFLPLECASHMIYEFTLTLTDPLSGEDGGTFKSPIKIIVSPLVKKILAIDKKKIKKIANGELTADQAGSLVTGGVFSDMSDGAAGGIALTLSLVILCICLYGIVWTLQKLVMGKARHAIRESLKWSNTECGGYISMLVGMGATIAVQSSSITTSTLTPLVGVGVISLRQMLPLTLGANIGTTCTGLLAAMVSGKRNALQIALCHLSFNIFGILVWYPLPVMRNVPLKMATYLGVFAFNFKWFPIAYIVAAFVVLPLMVLGISLLFEAGPAGIAFGGVACLIILAGMCYTVFAFYYRGGRAWLATLMEGIDEDNREIVAAQPEAAEEGSRLEVAVHTTSQEKVEV